MLVIALVISSILLISAMHCATGHPATLIGFTFGWIAYFICTICLFQPVVILHYLALTTVLFFLRAADVRSKRIILTSLLAATVLAYSFAVWTAIREQQEFARLRRAYPFESMERRVPEPSAHERRPLPAAASARLTEFERTGFGIGYRASDLKKLHDGTLHLFISSPGFGITRMSRPDESALLSIRQVPPIPQRVPRASAIPDGQMSEPRSIDKRDYFEFHYRSLFDFTDLIEMGYVKDRQHVAGFISHRFSDVPKLLNQPLNLETVDLVGLLRHEQPVAYVSADLPRMDELRTAPTRPLDEFETTALREIRKGEDLMVAEGQTHVRLLGSIRSWQQCVSCHGGERGDLLGAFSYTMRRADASGAAP